MSELKPCPFGHGIGCRDGALSRLLSAAREIRDIEREGGGSMDRVDEYRERWEAAISALCEALEEVESCRS